MMTTPLQYINSARDFLEEAREAVSKPNRAHALLTIDGAIDSLNAAKRLLEIREASVANRFFVSQYTDGPATRWNVIDRRTQDIVRRLVSYDEAADFAGELNLVEGRKSE